jgi:hypothetical protein
MELSNRPQVTPVWSLLSASTAPVAVDRSSRWQPISNLPPVGPAVATGSYSVQLARSLGIQILGS